MDWKEAFENAPATNRMDRDSLYIDQDPSYVGEGFEYEAELLAKYAHQTSIMVYLSMWKENEFRKNTHLMEGWSDFTWIPISHFYHLGGKEKNRHPIIEVLAIKEVKA